MVRKDRVYYRLRTHLEMLQDRARCLAYQQALEPVVKDKVVLDVGCGSGILSLFAARAGASQVLAVDMDIPPGAGEAARDNGLDDRIRFISGRIQDVELPVDSVDIIVSEWMGGLLLMEDMLPAVLYARDRWLKPGGRLLPDRAQLFLVPLDNVAGIDSRNYPTLRETISGQVWVSAVDPARFLAEPACILYLDLYTVPEAAVRKYAARFRFEVRRDGNFNGFGLWFDVLFGRAEPPLVLSTAPWLPPTHWAQALWILPADIDVQQGHEISGTFSQTGIKPSTASFRADIEVLPRTGKPISFGQTIEANPANMNTPGYSEGHIADQAMSGAYRGKDCLWIGCSMSMAVLMAARNGARSVAVLNHSPWASKAMQQFADQECLTQVRFLKHLPAAEKLRQREILLLGGADSSWQALVSHIKARRILGTASFRLRLCWKESPWKRFYGFDLSAFAPYDLEMYLQDQPEAVGLVLDDITDGPGFTGETSPQAEIVFRGKLSSEPCPPIDLPPGSYNCVKIGFHCGTVMLPLPESLRVDEPQGKRLQGVELIISVIEGEICRFHLKLFGPAWSISHAYEQPLTAMGHIVDHL